MKSSVSESKPFQSRSKGEIPGQARRKERLSCAKLKQAFLIDSSLRSERFRLFSEQKRNRGRGFSILIAREIKREPKCERGGRGRGRKETLADKPLDSGNLRSPANAAPY